MKLPRATRRVSRTHLQTKEVWSYTRDGGGPPEAGSQVQASNHCKLLSSKAMVVSVAAKGGIKSRQVWSGEASESKPSMTCRNSIGDVKTGVRSSPGISAGVALKPARAASGM